MRKLLLAGVMLALSGIAASAADLPRKYHAPSYYQQKSVYDWTGFYLGIEGGGLTGSTQSSTDLGFGFTEDSSSSRGAFWGGGLVGYRYQWNSLVFGAQADGDWTDWSVKYTDPVFIQKKMSHSWEVAFTGSLGVAIDRVLISAYGGGVLGGFKATEEVTGFATDTVKKDLWGARGGLSVDYAVSEHVTAGVFADYTRFQDLTHVDNALLVTTKWSPDEYRFGGRLAYRF